MNTELIRKLGIIFSSYGTPDYNEKSLKPWLNRDNCVISACSYRFKGFKGEDNKPNLENLTLLAANNNNLILFCDEKQLLPEHEARNKGLNHLLRNNCDVILILDSDEFYTLDQANFIFDIINNPDFADNAWYSIHFKNYVFDNKRWMSGFCPPRLFNVKYFGNVLCEFYWDNDVVYKVDNAYLESKIDYKQLPHGEIDKDKLHVKHLTWIDSERTKKKVAYQRMHFGRCSFIYNGEGKLIFDENYYKSMNQPIPEVFTDE